MAHLRDGTSDEFRLHPGGKSWRIARTVDRRVLRQVSEADVGKSVVLVFKAVGKGEGRIVMALTRAEEPKAYRASTHVVVVR